jgi:hypothetical protein
MTIGEQVWAMRKGHEARVGDWIEMQPLGTKFWPLDGRPEDVHLEAIAHHLARINRYNGGFKLDRYSVGEHAVAMANWFLDRYPSEPWLAYQALHHDDCEAVISDMTRPLKRNMPEFVMVEDKLWRSAFAPKLGLPDELNPRIKEADSRILVDEREQVVGRSENNWGIDHLEPLGVELTGKEPFLVKAMYLDLHARLWVMMGRAEPLPL